MCKSIFFNTHFNGLLYNIGCIYPTSEKRGNIMKNICIVGYGSVGPFHARALEETENACFYAVCDINPPKIELCKETYDVKGYVDYHI